MFVGRCERCKTPYVETIEYTPRNDVYVNCKNCNEKIKIYSTTETKHYQLDDFDESDQQRKSYYVSNLSEFQSESNTSDPEVEARAYLQDSFAKLIYTFDRKPAGVWLRHKPYPETEIESYCTFLKVIIEFLKVEEALEDISDSFVNQLCSGNYKIIENKSKLQAGYFLLLGNIDRLKVNFFNLYDYSDPMIDLSNY